MCREDSLQELLMTLEHDRATHHGICPPATSTAKAQKEDCPYSSITGKHYGYCEQLGFLIPGAKLHTMYPDRGTCFPTVVTDLYR